LSPSEVPIGETIDIGGGQLPIWPKGQEVRPLDDQGLVFKTRFADHEQYQGELISAIERRRADPAVKAQYKRALGGTKVYRLEDWDEPAARLINARAVETFKRAINSKEGHIDMAWANVYGSGDYAVAHSHIRSRGSVVYMLDDGAPDGTDPQAGLFMIIDPRFAPCCKIRPEYMTNPFCPTLEPGSMIAFPSSLVHAVNPHGGARPRITFAWNINSRKLEGDTLTMMGQGAAAGAA
jgi:hypothetical protein